MATRKQRARRTKIPRQQHLPEATAAANAAGRVLVEKYGEAPWILQAMEVVRGGIENCIRQLSGTAVPHNNASFNEGARYVHPARSADEIKADMAARRQNANSFAEVFQEEAKGGDDLFDRLSRTIGAEEEIPNAATNKPDNSSSMPWLS